MQPGLDHVDGFAQATNTHEPPRRLKIYLLRYTPLPPHTLKVLNIVKKRTHTHLTGTVKLSFSPKLSNCCKSVVKYSEGTEQTYCLTIRSTFSSASESERGACNKCDWTEITPAAAERSLHCARSTLL